MATTPNYGWVTPAPTDLVTDLPADFETFADAVDADLAGLLGGTTGQVLKKTSGTDHDFAFGVDPTFDLVTTAGDLVYGTAADTMARLGIGTAGQVLSVNSGATAPEWTTPAAAVPTYVGFSGRNTGNTTVNNNTFTEYLMNSETFDTDGFHSTATNTGRITIPTGKGGKYLLVFGSGWTAGFDTDCIVRAVIYKNGSATEPYFETASSTATLQQAPYASRLIELVATDYVQLFYWQNSGVAKTLGNSGYFSATFLGA